MAWIFAVCTRDTLAMGWVSAPTTTPCEEATVRGLAYLFLLPLSFGTELWPPPAQEHTPELLTVLKLSDSSVAGCGTGERLLAGSPWDLWVLTKMHKR